MDSINNLFSRDRFEPAPGVLYVVGTPIGNLGDFSPRAKSILKNVSVVACEDTRRSGILLKSFGAKATLLSFHQHNTSNRVPQILQLLKEQKSVALISDAGLPGISDPGIELVSAAKKSNFEVICIPGPCAAITALVSSGLPSKRFCFEGFLPTKLKERKQVLEEISKETKTTIIYESPHKLIKLLEELSQVCEKNRPLQVARELTKVYEESIGNDIQSVLDHFSNKRPQGECTLVLGGAQKNEIKDKSNSELIKIMQELINNGMSANEAAKQTAKETNYSKRFLYSLLHQSLLKNND